MGLKGILTERELRICKQVGCDPEAFAQAKARRAASKLGLGPEVVTELVRVSNLPRPKPQPRRAFIRRSPGRVRGLTAEQEADLMRGMGFDIPGVTDGSSSSVDAVDVVTFTCSACGSVRMGPGAASRCPVCSHGRGDLAGPAQLAEFVGRMVA